jgi:hypothetical protein
VGAKSSKAACSAAGMGCAHWKTRASGRTQQRRPAQTQGIKYRAGTQCGLSESMPKRTHTHARTHARTHTHTAVWRWLNQVASAIHTAAHRGAGCSGGAPHEPSRRQGATTQLQPAGTATCINKQTRGKGENHRHATHHTQAALWTLPQLHRPDCTNHAGRGGGRLPLRQLHTWAACAPLLLLLKLLLTLPLPARHCHCWHCC